jgi:adenosylcobinamide-GDP ribazoletransferase
MWNSFALAMQIVTGQSALSADPPTRFAARRAVALFPLVGALIGVLTAAIWTLGNRLWPGQALVSAALVLTAGTLATGGRAWNGLARAGDGWAAQGDGGDRSRAFAVMRDPRRGAAGIMTLVLVVVLKLAFISALPATEAGLSLILASALGRWASAFAFSAFPLASAASDDAETHAGLSDAGPNEFLIATVLSIACAALLPTRGLLTLVAVAVVSGPTAQAVSRRLGGFNAPLSQALGELGEVTALACLAIHS